MTKTGYGVIGTKVPKFPARKLLVVPHKDRDLTASYPAFGPDYFKQNIEEMQKPYSHPVTRERISFREPTTSESISAAAHDFGNLVKPQIFGLRWLQLGYIVRTSEGVFANPPKDSLGSLITDEKTLKSFLNNAKKVNGIWLCNRKDARDFGFAPYETFEQGVQNCDSFAQCGLARLLEHTEEKTAGSLREIGSPKFYKRGVHVCGFESVLDFGKVKDVLKIAGLSSLRYPNSGELYVGGDYWDLSSDGLAFGVLEKTNEAG